MTDAASAPTREFTITRVFDAPRELVFRAWTDPEQLTRWFGPRGCSTPRSSIEMDVRPGGHWRACMIVDADGTEYPTGGVYREVVEPERLVFTWADPGGGGEFTEGESVVTVVLADLGDKTEMTFHQSGFTTVQGRANVQDGWSQSLDRLAESLTRPIFERSEKMNLPTVVSREEWLAARKELLVKEKAATRARDALNAERRRLPMVRIEKDYVFDAPDGKRSLLDLFDGRRQLIVYHFMLDPSWDEGCPSCSLLVDNIGHLSHLHARNTSLVLVSRAPLAKIEAYRNRMGWTVPWVSSYGSDFNWDFGVTVDPSVRAAEYNYAPMEGEWAGELPGTSVFLRDSSDGTEVFHTYSSYARGGDVQLGTYTYLDLTPLGRQEDWEQPPGRSDGPFMSWVRRHDEYQTSR